MPDQDSTLLFHSSPVLKVSELNHAIFATLERRFPLLWVKGEVSNFTCAASGHWYFSIKDEQAQIRCVMFRGRAQSASFQPKEGDKIEVQALVSLYAPRGEVQLKVEAVRRTGQGQLFEAFLALKQRLEKEGLFAKERKRAIPLFPKQIGVMSSLKAAALRDVLTTLARRVPHIPVMIYPVPVQGEGAAEKIAAMIDKANRRQEVDVLIICRGGGSIEDLWQFNEEVVARAVSFSEIPIISGVGHETDFTMIDFVADARASTPTAAAEMVSCETTVLWQKMQDFAVRLNQAIFRRLEWQTQRLDRLYGRLIKPTQYVERQRQQILLRKQQIQHAMSSLLHRYASDLKIYSWRYCNVAPNSQLEMNKLFALSGRLSDLLAIYRNNQTYHVQALHDRLHLLNPAYVFKRGYAAIIDPDTQLAIRSAKQIQAHHLYQIVLAEETVDAHLQLFKNSLFGRNK